MISANYDLIRQTDKYSLFMHNDTFLHIEIYIINTNHNTNHKGCFISALEAFRRSDVAICKPPYLYYWLKIWHSADIMKVLVLDDLNYLRVGYFGYMIMGPGLILNWIKRVERIALYNKDIMSVYLSKKEYYLWQLGQCIISHEFL